LLNMLARRNNKNTFLEIKPGSASHSEGRESLL